MNQFKMTEHRTHRKQKPKDANSKGEVVSCGVNSTWEDEFVGTPSSNNDVALTTKEKCLVLHAKTYHDREDPKREDESEREENDQRSECEGRRLVRILRRSKR